MFLILPGDYVKWVYASSGIPIAHGTKVYSTTMNSWIPIGELSLVVFVDHEHMSWLNSRGYFHARKNDVKYYSSDPGAFIVIIPKVV